MDAVRARFTYEPQILFLAASGLELSRLHCSRIKHPQLCVILSRKHAPFTETRLPQVHLHLHTMLPHDLRGNLCSTLSLPNFFLDKSMNHIIDSQTLPL